MKLIYNLFNVKRSYKLTLLGVIYWLGTVGLNAQIIGNYEIDANGTASNTVYTDFQSVIDDLQGLSRTDGGPINSRLGGLIGGAYLGITGHATFTVKSGSGPYTLITRLTIPEITGMSSSATVTFKGNNETVTYAGSTAARATIYLNGADWFRFDSLKIINTRSAYAQCIRFANNADDNIIENCEIRTPDVTGATTSTTTGSVCILFGSAENTINGTQWGNTLRGTNGNRNIIRNNSLGGKIGAGAGSGPQIGIKLVGDAVGKGTDDNVIKDNYISNVYYRAVYVEGAMGSTIQGNEFTNPDVSVAGTWGSAAIFIDNTGIDSTGKTTDVKKNRIHHNFGTDTSAIGREYHGVYVNEGGGGDVNVNNNATYNLRAFSSLYGFRIGGLGKSTSLFYHNTFAHVDDSFNGSPLVYGYHAQPQSSSRAEFKNNIAEITAKGGSQTVERVAFFDRGWTTSTFDYNNGFVDRSGTGNPTVGDLYANSSLSTLALWQASGRGLNSTDTTAQFADYPNGDLTPLNPALMNTGDSLGIVDDINDFQRSLTAPYMGAFEARITSHKRVVNNTGFNIYPNPTRGIVNIEILNNKQNLAIQIFNVIGHRVATIDTKSQNNGVFKANLQGLASGIYLIRVNYGTTAEVRRIVLSK